MPADFSESQFGSGEVTTSSPLKALEDYFLPSETWFTNGRCLILVVKHPTKLFTVLSID